MSNENKKVSASIQVLPAHVQWKQTRKSVQVFKSYQLMSNENKQESQCKYLSLTSSCPMKTNKKVSASI